jgi:hypothetical protein
MSTQEVFDDSNGFTFIDTVVSHSSGLLDALAQLKSDTESSDFSFVIGANATTFRVHKTLVGLRSPVFKKMMSNGMKETAESQVRTTFPFQGTKTSTTKVQVYETPMGALI